MATTIIERFVRAFSTPYPGAWTYCKDQKIIIDEIKVISKETFHPFCNGRIITQLDDGSVYVAAGEGIIQIFKVKINGVVSNASDKLKIMSSLITPSEILFSSKQKYPELNQ